jgi:uncharacterized metal-binding protein YceD (DUF177 family)
MPVLINLRHLERKNVRLDGEVPVAELDMEGVDELIHVDEPLHYDVEAQKIGEGILVHGNLQLTLRCECVRCLKAFSTRLD